MSQELTGKKIVKVRPMTLAEYDKEGWSSKDGVVVLELDDGMKLFASSDEEGNNGGELFGNKNGVGYLIQPEVK
ncbi:hypothetical protein ES705_36794 [subsurface metagenome]